jgi:cobyrinic acid a,c-diamide synthase
MAKTGFALTATASGSGKTLITLGLLRALRENDYAICSAKSGPDYIDPAFHDAATGQHGFNLDSYAMRPELIKHLAARADGDLLVVEGAMGVADGGVASTANLAAILNLPLILIMDVRAQAETAAMIAGGIRYMLSQADQPAHLAGVILNRCRSIRHQAMIEQAMTDAKIPVLGALPDHEHLTLPSRHLGLVQAAELSADGRLEDVMTQMSKTISDHIDLHQLVTLARPLSSASGQMIEPMAPPAQRIAIAMDKGFAFSYRHLIESWQRQGAEIIPFSPLADEAADTNADLIYLPGGYPELSLDVLANATRLKTSLIRAAQKQVHIYGECGGYMILGKAIIDEKGKTFPMTGLLDLTTSFAERSLHLGYRKLKRLADMPVPALAYGHEFHYTTAISENGQPLFQAQDRQDKDCGKMGLVKDTVFGSYAHLIATA